MAKQRIIAGYNLNQDGILTPGEPIKTKVSIPHDAIVRDITVDPVGNFVLFAEVWSHPEGTEVKFREVEYLVAAGAQVIVGSWKYYKTVPAGVTIFHVFERDKPSIVS